MLQLLSVRQLLRIPLAIILLIGWSPAFGEAPGWPSPPEGAELVGRWEVWHSAEGQMREYVQIESRAGDVYVALQSHKHFNEPQTKWQEIRLRQTVTTSSARLFAKVGNPHGESYAILSGGELGIMDAEGTIPIFDTHGRQVPAVSPFGGRRSTPERAQADTSAVTRHQGGQINPYRQALVRNYAIEEVRSRLVSPRSARFSSLRDTRVQQSGNWTYIVAGHVDTRNRAGSTVRIRWVAEVDCFNEAGSVCRVTRAGLED